MKLREESGAYGKKLVFYEDMLSADSDYALREGSMHFEENSKVHKAMHKIADRLGALCVPFAFVGGMARMYGPNSRSFGTVFMAALRETYKEPHAL